MKYHKFINTVAALITFLILGWAALIQPKGILNLGSLTGLWSYVLILLCVTPVGRLTLGDRNKALSFPAWFGKLLRAQIVLGVFSIGALCAFLGLGPYFAQDTINMGLIKETMNVYRTWQWAFFPWGIYGICALVLAYITYIKKGSPFVYQITRENCPRRYEPLVKTYVDGTLSSASIMAYSLVVASIILLFSYSLESKIGAHHFYVPFLTISVLSLFMPWYMLRKGRRMINRVTQRKATINQIYFLFIPPLVILLIIAAVGNGWFVKRYAEYYQQFQCSQCSTLFSQAALVERLSTLYWGWWLLWTPLASSYIASISQGRTVRELALGIFLVPILGYVFFALGGNSLLMLFITKLHKVPLLVSLFLLATLIWYCFYRCNKNQSSSSLFFSGYMPDNSERRSRIWLQDGSKITAISKLASKLAMNVTVILFLHSLMGWYGIQLQVAVMSAILLGVIYSEVYFLVYRFFQDRAWQKNHHIPPFS